MRVLLVGPDHEENLSIRYLSASLLQAGHETVLGVFNSPVDASAVANAARDADVVGLSMCFQARAREFLGLARRIKSREPGKLVVAGGHYASCAAEALLAHHSEIDVIVVHEGEQALVEIADHAANLREHLPEIAGVAYREGRRVRLTSTRPMRDDLDALPFPDRRGPVYRIAGVPTSYLMGSRGCFGHCAYCCITTLHRLAPGKRFRQRSVDGIADEMAALYRERGTRQFIFHDDNFLVPSEAFNHARIGALERALDQRGVRDIALAIKCRPADATREVIGRLKNLGLIRVFLGVEASTAQGLSVLEREQSVGDSERALETCRELDVSAQFTLMTFNPGATLETLRADVAFLRRYRDYPLNFGRTEIYAGTPLETRMIELGRARGNYLAREYRITDPVADQACNASLRAFHSRCWTNGSLMQQAIGLDHVSAVVKRFYRGVEAESLSRRVTEWTGLVNRDTIDLLEEVIEESARAGGRASAQFAGAMRALDLREQLSRKEFLREAMSLTAGLQRLRFPTPTAEPPAVLWSRLAKPAAAALLAIGIPAAEIPQQAIAQQSQTAPAVSGVTQQKGNCTLMGRVIDPSGAAVSGAKVQILLEGTRVSRQLTTDQEGRYAANDLPAGKYSLTAESPGFRTALRSGIGLGAGASERVDVGLTLELGLCEYVASQLDTSKGPDRLSHLAKPEPYVVGQRNDDGTLRGIAKVVYGDAGKWVQIFEANRGVFPKPGPIPLGTTILIPPRKRAVPRVVSRRLPRYPEEARREQIVGDVVLDVLLNLDGTVSSTSVIDGNPMLAEAASKAVLQWSYRPLLLDGNYVVKLVVVITFSEKGKVGNL